jgi:hypothetical protein
MNLERKEVACVILVAKDMRGRMQAHLYPLTREIMTVCIGKCVIPVPIQMHTIGT